MHNFFAYGIISTPYVLLPQTWWSLCIYQIKVNINFQQKFPCLKWINDIWLILQNYNPLTLGLNYLFRSDPQRFREKFQQFEGMGERCKLPLGVSSQNAIQMQENHVQFNTFWSKI